MRRPMKESDITWDTVELLMPGAQIAVWSREDDKSLLDLNAELDADDLCPEGDVTKQFWKNKYGAIEQWRNESKSQ